MSENDQHDFLTDLEYTTATTPFDKRKYMIWAVVLGCTIVANLYSAYLFRAAIEERSGREAHAEPFEVTTALFVVLALPLTAMVLSGFVSFTTYRSYPYRGRYFPVAIIIAVVLELLCMLLFFASYSDLFLQ